MRHHIFWILLGSFLLPVQAQVKNCSLPNSSYTPLDELGNTQFRGQIGGLYANGLNKPSGNYLNVAMSMANGIVPLDTTGKYAPNGKIVFAGVGASNPRTEFAAFTGDCDTFSSLNPSLKLVNTCIGGQGVQKMNNPLDNYWKSTQKLFDSLKLNFRQVQVVWVETDNTQASDTVFPRAALALVQDLKTLLQTIKVKFPNVKLCYLSGRAYSGWVDVTGGGSPGKGLLHPRDYYNGWAIKWLVDSAIANNKGFNYSGVNAEIPLPLHGSYHWTNGSQSKKDGFVFNCNDDVGNDGLHLTPAGEQKIGKRMFDFFSKDTTTKPWFLKPALASDMNLQTVNNTKLFPNPSIDGKCQIQTNGNTQIVKIEVLSYSGSIIYSAQNLNVDQVEIHVPNISLGSYVVVVYKENFSVERKIWIVTGSR